MMQNFLMSDVIVHVTESRHIGETSLSSGGCK